MVIGDDLSGSHLSVYKHMSSDYRKVLSLNSDPLDAIFIFSGYFEDKEDVFERLNQREVLSLRSDIFHHAIIISKGENAREIHSRALCGDVRHPSTQGSLFSMMLKSSSDFTFRVSSSFFLSQH